VSGLPFLGVGDALVALHLFEGIVEVTLDKAIFRA
jgi:hypothetical protein